MSRAADSYYRATANPYEAFAPLSGENEADVVVIGGGYAGLNTALGLAERGVEGVRLLEAEHIGYGASGRNGGFVFSGFSLGEQALLKRLGQERAQRLFQYTVAGVEQIRERIRRYDIGCDPVDEGVLWLNWFRDPGRLRERQKLLADYFGTEWEWVPREKVRERVGSLRYSDALFERNALHLHPLNYAIGLAQAAAEQGVTVHENSRVTGIERQGAGWRVRSSAGSVRAGQVVLACGGYLAGLDRRIDRAILPIATYVMATEPLHARMQTCLRTRSAIYDTRFAFDYYRPLKDTRLLWGGRISVRERSPEAVKRLLYGDLKRVFPQLEGVRIDYAWSGLMSYARQQMPQLGTRGDGLWWAQAFGGHGLAPTTAVGELLAAAIASEGDGWRALEDFGLVRSFRPLGFLGAQASYWWYELQDWLKETIEG